MTRHGGAAAGRARGAKPPTQRQLRVAEEIRHVLAGIFTRGEFRDPDLADVVITVTEVRISPDLRQATAFVTRLGRDDVAAKLPALKRAAPYCRVQLAHALRLRVAPEIRFEVDTALDYACHINKLLHMPVVARDLKNADKQAQGAVLDPSCASTPSHDGGIPPDRH